MLKSISIKRLFDRYNYNIGLKNDGITILTGPNGYGKTTILNLIMAVSKNVPWDLFSMPYEELLLTFMNNDFIRITKTNDKNDEIKYEDSRKNNKIINKNEILVSIKTYLSRSSRMISYYKEENKWYDRRSDLMLTVEDLISEDTELADSLKEFTIPQLNTFTDNCYIIPAQRLYKLTNPNEIKQYFYDEVLSHSSRRNSKPSFFDSISFYSAELRREILSTMETYAQTSQELDSTFPDRLFNATEDISKIDFDERFSRIQKIQDQLSKYNISEQRGNLNPSYKYENAKALKVYIDDTEKKLDTYKDLIAKLQLFLSLVNKHLIDKELFFNRETGIEVKTDNHQKLELTKLSSGEQQEIVLLYELIFGSEQKKLVLIDEPEISLHVIWQKMFINNLNEIRKLSNHQFIVATHSPQIVNDNWDMVVDLWSLTDAARK